MNIGFQSTEPRQNVAFALAQLRGRIGTGRCRVDFRIPCFQLQPGIYFLTSRIMEHDIVQKLAGSDELLLFKVVPLAEQIMKYNSSGYFEINGEWQWSQAEAKTS